MLFSVNDGSDLKWRKADTVLPLLHTGTVRIDMSESETLAESG